MWQECMFQIHPMCQANLGGIDNYSTFCRNGTKMMLISEVFTLDISQLFIVTNDSGGKASQKENISKILCFIFKVFLQ